ncbi:MAG: hypothetical protein GX649_18635 [Chloroflexi bacterium]|nr:hypothetical protein [Chloroflexota bacterium]
MWSWPVRETTRSPYGRYMGMVRDRLPFVRRRRRSHRNLWAIGAVVALLVTLMAFGVSKWRH